MQISIVYFSAKMVSPDAKQKVKELLTGQGRVLLSNIWGNNGLGNTWVLF
jgi:hypothetical protein